MGIFDVLFKWLHIQNETEEAKNDSKDDAIRQSTVIVSTSHTQNSLQVTPESVKLKLAKTVETGLDNGFETHTAFQISAPNG